MWVRAVAKLIAIFGFYAIVLSRIANQGGKSYSYCMLEIAAVTALFIVAAVFLLTRRPRARPSLDEPDE
jgi:hypothetical protein